MVDPFPELEQELGLLLRRARASTAAVAARVHPDLEAPAYPLLVHISHVPGIRATELAAHVGVGRATISRQLRRLEDLGLLARTPDPADCRAEQLHLTAEGERKVQAGAQARREWLRAALSDWSPDDVSDLARSLGRLNTAVAERMLPTRAPESPAAPTPAASAAEATPGAEAAPGAGAATAAAAGAARLRPPARS